MLPEEKQKLLDYIKTAIDVETDIETQNQISAEYQTWIAAKKPVLIKKDPPRPAYVDESRDDKGGVVLCMVFGIPAAILGFYTNGGDARIINNDNTRIKYSGGVYLDDKDGCGRN